jgi:CO/xanthine dehydrogenase Mo-binding subunit
VAHDSKFTNQKFKLVGTRVMRPDGVDKVTGRARYGADTFAPGQLVGAILRSPHAHAKIRRIDTGRAEKLKGVKTVITSADLPDLTDGDNELYDILENCMARGKALYDGHAIAAVAASDAETARKALQLIKVDYKVLPHVTDVDEAIKPGAPIIQPRVRTKDKPRRPTNIAGVSTYGHGDVDAGFEQADVIIEKSYRTEQVHQGYIEPHACLASVGPERCRNSR